jgi:hypothetical protein
MSLLQVLILSLEVVHSVVVDPLASIMDVAPLGSSTTVPTLIHPITEAGDMVVALTPLLSRG